jgi:hypothetical protein
MQQGEQRMAPLVFLSQKSVVIVIKLLVKEQPHKNAIWGIIL